MMLLLVAMETTHLSTRHSVTPRWDLSESFGVLYSSEVLRLMCVCVYNCDKKKTKNIYPVALLFIQPEY